MNAIKTKKTGLYSGRDEKGCFYYFYENGVKRDLFTGIRFETEEQSEKCWVALHALYTVSTPEDTEENWFNWMRQFMVIKN